ncbi:hypothetical protein Scep_020265 [Stephania cephalantha]|uniref:Subtilisin-like protease n=1 Tax=Stephania cephalantha TaxID=152367 RepID=A0AAP0ICB6_9MAGN
MPGTYIIHMDTSLMPKVFSSHHSWYIATLSSIQNRNLIYTYSNVVHGFSATFSNEELEEFQTMPGFVSSIRDVPVTLDTTHTPEFLHLNSFHGAWPASHYGEGVIVGVVDSGVWPESESFRDDGMAEVPSKWRGECMMGTSFNSSMCNKKLIGARYFNKGLLANNPNLTVLVNSSRDTDGHGTHTSSIAAGNYVDGASYFGYAKGLARGMAPLAHVAMYKALWPEGGYASDVIAAIDQAIEDGVDILSLSLGQDGLTLYEDPIAIASFAAMEKGIFVASSAGNSGPSYKSLHNGIPWILTVGASSIDRDFSGVATLNNGVTLFGMSLYPGNSSLKHLPLELMNKCDDIEKLKKVGYKIVVCIDTNESLGDQVEVVGVARVAGAIFITNTNFLEFYIKSSFPAIFMNLQNGQAILDYIRNPYSSSPFVPRASLEFRKTRIGTKPAPFVPRFSSRGPSLSCPAVLKPDIVAPGTLVLSSWTRVNTVADLNSHHLFSNFNIESGTSMSCPHVAGLAALIKSVHPGWSPAAIQSAIMTTADVIDNTFAAIKDAGDNYKVASPLAMGAGQVNPNKALDPGLIYDADAQDYVNLLCSMNFTMKQIKTITRSSHPFGCSNRSSDLNYPSFIAFFNEKNDSSMNVQAKEFKRTVTKVGGHSTSVYKARITPIDGFLVNVAPKVLSFKEKYEKLSYKLTVIKAGPRRMNDVVVAHGSLTWVEVGGHHEVRSPIVATSLSA